MSLQVGSLRSPLLPGAPRFERHQGHEGSCGQHTGYEPWKEPSLRRGCRRSPVGAVRETALLGLLQVLQRTVFPGFQMHRELGYWAPGAFDRFIFNGFQRRNRDFPRRHPLQVESPIRCESECRRVPSLFAADRKTRPLRQRVAIEQLQPAGKPVSGPDREVTGAVLEKLVDPGELVTPQTFGGTRGPSSSLVAVANLQDLQIEVDIDESKLARVSLGQRCVISPVSYPDKRYQGQVAEIAPEANRAKGTVQVKVQILEPDRFLTPELSATVDFLDAAK